MTPTAFASHAGHHSTAVGDRLSGVGFLWHTFELNSPWCSGIIRLHGLSRCPGRSR
jgi:hypothetical protein